MRALMVDRASGKNAFGEIRRNEFTQLTLRLKFDSNHSDDVLGVLV